MHTTGARYSIYILYYAKLSVLKSNFLKVQNKRPGKKSIRRGHTFMVRSSSLDCDAEQRGCLRMEPDVQGGC